MKGNIISWNSHIYSTPVKKLNFLYVPHTCVSSVHLFTEKNTLEDTGKKTAQKFILFTLA